MAKEYTQKEIGKAMETLPDELRDTIFSFETDDLIWGILDRHGVADEKRNEVTKYVGYVLAGLVPLAGFAEVLNKELKLPKKIAEGVAHEINRFIFYPVKPALEQLHRMEPGSSATVVPKKPAPEEQENEQVPPEKPSGPDAYREPIE